MTELDVLLRLRRWRTRLERSGAPTREALARRVTVARSISEIEMLRREVERLEAERAQLPAVVASPLRLRVPR
jgi:phage host-nuclease inhibitor protein Gam